MDIMELKLNDITINDDLNVRDSLDDETVEDYKQCFDQLPPVVVFDTDDGYLLADGFHRCKAAKRLGREEIEVNVMQGTRQAAEEYAATANLQHGKPLTRAERRKAVERMLMLHTKRSDRWIAEDMGVSKNTVAKYREELEAGGQIDQVDKFIGKDGKEYPREVPHPKRDEQPPDEQKQPQETAPTAVEECPQATEVEATSDEIKQGADAEPQAEQPEPDADEPQFYCDERFVSLDRIKEHIGKPVRVVASAGKGGANAEHRGTILGIIERDGEFILELETETGLKRKIPTGTTTGKPTDIGILGVTVISLLEDSEIQKADDITEIQVDETPRRPTDNGVLKDPPEVVIDKDENIKHDTFDEYYNWIMKYSFDLVYENIESAKEVCVILTDFVEQLKRKLSES